MTYGEKIAQLRKQHKMTQAELGEALNVTFQAVSKWENGLSEPDLATIKKICDLFNVSVSEFFGTKENEPIAAATPEAVAVPLQYSAPPVAYCEKCRKPLYYASEYVVSRTGRGGHTQHIVCNSCKKQQEEQQHNYDVAEAKKDLRRGLIWGAVGGIVLAVGAVIYGTVSKNDLVSILGAVLGVYGGFAFIAQMIWGNSVRDCLEFFLKSFRMPGVIFTLDLDGIFFLITVKILGAILSAILSVICFLAGLVISIIYSMFAFPIALINQIRETR